MFNAYVLSNQWAIKVENGDRRYFIPSISKVRVGDSEYFKKLYSFIQDDMVMESFYWDCIDIENTTPFNERVIPETSSKSDLLNDHLLTIYEFIKVKYVLKEKGLDNVVAYDLYKLFITFCKDEGIRPSPKNETYKRLEEIGIHIQVGGQNKSLYKYTAAELLAIYRKNGFIT